jgi:hypothetical protein
MAVVLNKSLTATDVDYRLTFEMEGLRYFNFADGVNYTDFNVVDLRDGRVQELRLIKRGSGSHPKPVVSKGWKGYVSKKGLRIGDWVTIRENDDGRAPYSIQVQRTHMSFQGEAIWYDL